MNLHSLQEFWNTHKPSDDDLVDIGLVALVFWTVGLPPIASFFALTVAWLWIGGYLLFELSDFVYEYYERRIIGTRDAGYPDYQIAQLAGPTTRS